MRKYTKYPEFWDDIKKAVHKIYGGSYCMKISWKHSGNVQIHHYVPLSRAKYEVEYWHLNELWNLEMLCAYHHQKRHNGRKTIWDVDKEYKPKKGKAEIGWLHRFYWWLKRHYYYRRYEKRYERKEDYHILFFWNYTNWGTKRRKRKLKKTLEDLL